MAIDLDLSVAGNGDIRYIGDAHGGGSPGYYTVIELHRFLQDLADDAVAIPDDILDITFDTPSDRSTDNIITLINNYNIDDTLSEHLYDGSIIQSDGDTIYDGIVNYGNQGVYIEVIQNGALLSPNYWSTGLNPDVAQGISHRFMIKVRDAASDIDGRRLLGITREFNNTYAEFPINGSGRGNNVLALSNGADLNNATAAGTVATWSSIVNNNEGYVGLDINGDSVSEFYYSEWTKGIQGINDVFERAKWLTRRGSVETLYGVPGEIFRGITHEIDIDTNTGTFNAFETVTWSGGTAQMLAIDSTTAGTKMWIQLLTGVPPTDGQVMTGSGSSASAAVNTTLITRDLKSVFIGDSTGSSIVGAYGIGMDIGDVTAADKFTDLSNTLNEPPNNVQFSVGGLVSSEDRVLVADYAGDIAPNGDPQPNYDQLTLNGTLSGGETTVTVNEVIPSDTPTTGTIRIFNGDTYELVTYTGYSTNDFTGCVGVVASGASANVFISYLDLLATAPSESFTSVYSGDRSLIIRVRDGGGTPIKTFVTTGTLGSAGGGTTAIRTTDE